MKALHVHVISCDIKSFQPVSALLPQPRHSHYEVKRCLLNNSSLLSEPNSESPLDV